MKREIKIAIPILGGLIVVVSLFRTGLFRNSQNDFNQVLDKILVGDEMKVNADKNVDAGKIKITLAFSDKTVFEHGRFPDNIGEHYGGPVFDVYYDQVLIGRALHDNSNNWYTNEFIFNFYLDNQKVRFQFKTNGRDSKGEEGYIYIDKSSDSARFESHDSNGNLITQWKE